MRHLRILDFDIENRPLAYWYDGATTAEVTAIAAQFVGEKKMHCWLLGKHTAKELLEGFRKLYDEADIVTGHLIRGHDLPIINGALIELGLLPLSPKLTSDTCRDLLKMKDLSKSQENLAEMLGIAAEKVHMSNAAWRQSNRLQPDGLKRTEARVTRDVKQNIAIRKELLKRDLLGAPKVWYPR